MIRYLTVRKTVTEDNVQKVSSSKCHDKADSQAKNIILWRKTQLRSSQTKKSCKINEGGKCWNYNL